MRVSRARRPGLSLLEVLVALTIFLLAFVALGRLIVMGTDRALEAQERSRAALLGQSKLAEVAAGVVPLTPQPDAPFDEAPEWRWALECEQGSVPGLWNVTVRVHKLEAGRPSISYAFSRLLLDPSLRGNVLDEIPDPDLAQDSTNSGNGSSSSSGTSSQGMGGSSGGTSGSTSSPRGGN